MLTGPWMRSKSVLQYSCTLRGWDDAIQIFFALVVKPVELSGQAAVVLNCTSRGERVVSGKVRAYWGVR